MSLATSIPETGFLRIRQILGDPKSDTPPLIPVSRSSWWAGVKSGRYPKPIKMGPKTTCWRAEDIRKLIETGALL
jgi:prophage regulatory protein